MKLRSGPKFRSWTLRQKSIHFLPSSYTSRTADNSISQGHTNCHHHLKNKKTTVPTTTFKTWRVKELSREMSWNVLKTVITMCMWQDCGKTIWLSLDCHDSIFHFVVHSARCQPCTPCQVVPSDTADTVIATRWSVAQDGIWDICFNKNLTISLRRTYNILQTYGCVHNKQINAKETRGCWSRRMDLQPQYPYYTYSIFYNYLVWSPQQLPVGSSRIWNHRWCNQLQPRSATEKAHLATGSGGN